MVTVSLKINEELNGIELYFTSKPDKKIRENLKANKFRWSSFKNCWYTKQNEKAFQFASSLTNNEEVTAAPTKAEKKVSKKQNLSLWDATRWNGIELTESQKEQDCKEIAKEIRTHIRKRFPNCKFSVRVPYYGKIDVDLKSSPFEENSKYVKAILAYCNELVEAYRVCYDAGDSYSDIPAHYNFHFFRADASWDYTQTEQTEEIKKDMIEFDSKLAEFEKVEEERKEKEYQEYVKEQERRNEEYKKRQEEEKKKIENIYNSIEVNELDENNQYFVIGAEFANLNKNNTLDQYKEEVHKGDYNKENVKITKEIYFNSKEALNNFSNMLLVDFDFLAGTGGSFTDDNRINSMTDFYNMDDLEKKNVQWNLYGVAIYFNNKLQFVIDAQGYSYARYVGLTDNATIEKNIQTEQIISDEELQELKLKAYTLEDISTTVIEELGIFNTWQKENWNKYKKTFKSKLNKYKIKLTKEIIQQIEIEELKASMYKILTEVDSIQEQFKKADIQQGEKITLFYISDWGGIITNKITFESFEHEKYAQYDNNVKLTFKPESKRKLYYNHFHSDLLVYKGWHNLPDNILNEVFTEDNGYKITKGKYLSTDKRQFDEILNYFDDKQGIKPIINTYKPTF